MSGTLKVKLTISMLLVSAIFGQAAKAESSAPVKAASAPVKAASAPVKVASAPVKVASAPVKVATERKVQVQLEDDIEVTYKRGDLLVEESPLPPGSVVEVSLQEYQNPVNLPYWSGSRDREAQFVRKIRVVKVPGFSAQDINEINSWLPVEGLYISKKQLGEGIVVRDSADKRSKKVTLKRPASIMRNDGPKPTDIKAPPEGDSQNLETGEADGLIEKMLQAQQTVGRTGQQQKFCEGCMDQQLFQKFVDQGVPARALEKAMKMLQKNPGRKIKNRRFMAIADYTKDSTQKRLFLLNLQTGKVDAIHMSHGKNSETRLGFAGRFSNRNGSYQTPPGFHVTSGIGVSRKEGRRLILNGIEPGINDNSARRGILIHTKYYAKPEFLRQHGYMGRSWGCITVPPKKLEDVLNKLQNGALVYNYTGK